MLQPTEWICKGLPLEVRMQVLPKKGYDYCMFCEEVVMCYVAPESGYHIADWPNLWKTDYSHWDQEVITHDCALVENTLGLIYCSNRGQNAPFEYRFDIKALTLERARLYPKLQFSSDKILQRRWQIVEPSIESSKAEYPDPWVIRRVLRMSWRDRIRS